MTYSESLSSLGKLFAQTGSSLDLVLDDVVSQIFSCFKDGNKLLICGNGGSAADAQHFAAEFASSFNPKVQRKSLPAIALTTNTSILTAYGNDFHFDGIFSRQVEGIGKPGDILIAISTSGESLNCVKALEKANQIGLMSIALTSENSTLARLASIAIEIPSKNTQAIQAFHLTVYHYICEMVEERWMKMESNG